MTGAQSLGVEQTVRPCSRWCRWCSESERQPPLRGYLGSWAGAPYPGRPSTPRRSGGLERTMAELLAAVNLSTSGP